MSQEDNWFRWNGSGKCVKVPPISGDFKGFQKVHFGNKEFLLVETDKKIYNLYRQGKKWRFQGLK